MKIYMSYFAKLNKILDAGYLPISIARRVGGIRANIRNKRQKRPRIALF